MSEDRDPFDHTPEGLAFALRVLSGAHRNGLNETDRELLEAAATALDPNGKRPRQAPRNSFPGQRREETQP